MNPAATPTRHRDRQVAEALGYSVVLASDLPYFRRYHLIKPNGQPFGSKEVGPFAVETEAEAWRLVPRFSTDIAAAWQLVEHLQERGIGLIVKAYPPGYAMRYTAAVPGTTIGAHGDTAAAAIAAAFLACVTRPGGRT